MTKEKEIEELAKTISRHQEEICRAKCKICREDDSVNCEKCMSEYIINSGYIRKEKILERVEIDTDVIGDIGMKNIDQFKSAKEYKELINLPENKRRILKVTA
jgi:hypothetical protein